MYFSTYCKVRSRSAKYVAYAAYVEARTLQCMYMSNQNSYIFEYRVVKGSRTYQRLSTSRKVAVLIRGFLVTDKKLWKIRFQWPASSELKSDDCHLCQEICSLIRGFLLTDKKLWKIHFQWPASSELKSDDCHLCQELCSLTLLE